MHNLLLAFHIHLLLTSAAHVQNIKAGVDDPASPLEHNVAKSAHSRSEPVIPDHVVLRRQHRSQEKDCPQNVVSSAVEAACQRLPKAGPCAFHFPRSTAHCSAKESSSSNNVNVLPMTTRKPAMVRRQQQQPSSSQCDQQIVWAAIESLCQTMPAVGVCDPNYPKPAGCSTTPSTIAVSYSNTSVSLLPPITTLLSDSATIVLDIPVSVPSGPMSISQGSSPFAGQGTVTALRTNLLSRSGDHPLGSAPSALLSRSANSSITLSTSTSNKCGPTSVSTIPGCWGAGACSGIVAFQQGKGYCHPNYCMCAGKTAPYISKTVGTAISSDCDYSYYPKADLPLPSLTFCATAAKNARSSAAIITGAPGTGSGSIPFATALAQEEVQQSQSQSSTTTQSDAANYTQPAPTQATEEPACETSDDYWQLTVKNYQEAETDQFLYHWWHGGDWVKYDSEYYPPEPNRNDDGVHQGVAQQLPAQAAGYQTFNCLGSSVNNDCHSPTDDFRQYCKQGMQRWVYFAWISMFHMWSVMNDMKEQAVKGIQAALETSEDIISTFQRDGGEPDPELYDAQTAMQVLGAIITMIGVLLPLPRGVPNWHWPRWPREKPKGDKPPRDKPKPTVPVAVPTNRPGESIGAGPSGVHESEPAPAETGLLEVPGSDVGNLLGVAPGITISGGTGVWQRLVDPMSGIDEKVKDLRLIIGAISSSAEKQMTQFSDDMFSHPGLADQIMILMTGGWALSTPKPNLLDTRDAWKTDVIARAVNWQWRIYPIYISFTNLDDDDQGTKCAADTLGPQVAKYCGDRGVYYLNMYDPKSMGLGIPYGADDLELYKIDIVKLIESSVKSFRAQGNIVALPNLHVYDNIANKDLLQKIADNATSGATTLQGLPGQFTIPVCDQGRNHWIFDWETQKTNQRGEALPCACGPQGKDTLTFIEAARLNITSNLGTSMGYFRNYCTNVLQKPKDSKINPGWEGIGGPPPEGKICYDRDKKWCAEPNKQCRPQRYGPPQCS